MKPRDMDYGKAILVSAIVAVLLLVIASGLYWLITYVSHNVIDQRACRNRGGYVHHFDPKHETEWRCVGGAVER